ncbi:hypothetical protein CHLRE_06g262200v5 [Chlamydomonas reinhardtii]|uniref:Uncharacterized protein n=1 Tax=Chlamydomonas reinhardtii TaxID=3055 RepID=A0A2K3DMU0_CHLRE|nr:uncharacterized protein CHLRE_06g262200v5 [Chlamydomonas reinhardtii]PNW81831.1 hypothetical protein CHLRE_06g262200v5 [Chlamydomonas reinhardtii]
MAVNSGGAGDAQRELWREARRHIGEYESRTSELALDLAAGAKALAAAKDELAGLRREAQSQRAAKDAADRAALDEHDRMAPGHVRRTQTLSRQRDSELAESGRLTHQLAGLGAQWEAAVAAAREQEKERQTHLLELQAHLDSLRAYRMQCQQQQLQQAQQAAQQQAAQQQQAQQQPQQVHTGGGEAASGDVGGLDVGMTCGQGEDQGEGEGVTAQAAWPSVAAPADGAQWHRKRPLLEASDAGSGGGAGALDDTMSGAGADQRLGMDVMDVMDV